MPDEKSTALTVVEGGQSSLVSAGLGLGPPSVSELTSLRTMATEIAMTEFVPSGFRGRGPAVLAAILTGRELGIGPMAALKQISVIEGKPTLSAELMLALIRRAGHKVEGPEPSDTGASLTGIRRDTGKSLVVTFDQEDARKAQLLGKPSWQRYPRSMYWARCVAMLARMHFSDVLMGMIYTPEEMGAEVDEDNQVIEMRQTTGAESKLEQAMRAKEEKPSEATPSTPRTPSSAETSLSPAATKTEETSPASKAIATSANEPTSKATTDAATAPVTSTPSAPEPESPAFGGPDPQILEQVKAKALELAKEATLKTNKARYPNQDWPPALVDAKAKMAITQYMKQRLQTDEEHATPEQWLSLIEAIQVTLGPAA